jgi:NADP-dependent 3-hydroxy acid dehydrogenase YdfG
MPAHAPSDVHVGVQRAPMCLAWPETHAQGSVTMDGMTTVVITGASSGIGAALATELSRRGGYRLALVARRDEALQRVVADCGGAAFGIMADVTERESVQRIVTDVIAREGGIDVWVNNVGRGINRMPTHTTDADIDLMMLVNVKSALYGMQEVLPHFQARGRGQIINVSSMLGRTPFATFRAAYCGAKHFLNAMTDTFRREVQATHPDIRVSLVSPGIVATDFGTNAAHGGPDSRTLPGAQDVAELGTILADLIAAPRDDIYTRAGSRQMVLDYLGGLGQDP